MQTRHFVAPAYAQMSLTAIERTLQQVQINQLLDDALNRSGVDAVLLGNRLIGLVECSPIASKRFDLGIERLLGDGQAFVQPNLCRDPDAFKLAISHHSKTPFSIRSRSASILSYN